MRTVCFVVERVSKLSDVLFLIVTWAQGQVLILMRGIYISYSANDMSPTIFLLDI